MCISYILLFLLFGVFIWLTGLSYMQSARLKRMEAALKDALHKKAEITNFLSLFSQNLKTLEELEDAMNMTARYVADLIEAESVCIFIYDRDRFLSAAGICGAFPILNRGHKHVLTKPKFIMEILKKTKIKIGEGIIGEVAETGEPLLIEDAHSDPRLEEANSITPIRTMMAVPLTDKGEFIGVICAVNNRKEREPFSITQFNRLKFIASQVVLTYNLIKIYTSLSEQQRIEQELELARQIQFSLLPEYFPAWGDFLVHSFARPAKEVSGDFYDFFPIDEDRMLVFIGDAAGKGIPACMIMAMTKSFIHSQIKRFVNLKSFLYELNENLYNNTDGDRFITIGCCLLDKKENTIEYARGGHTSLLIFVHGHRREFYPDGSALGLLPSQLAKFGTITFKFVPGTTIMLFTDGITEALNSQGEEFGMSKLRNIFDESCINRETPDDIIKDILNGIDNFTGGALPQSDDQTILLLQHKGFVNK